MPTTVCTVAQVFEGRKLGISYYFVRVTGREIVVTGKMGGAKRQNGYGSARINTDKETARSMGRFFGMATTKITITLPDEQIHSIRELVAAGRGGSVSAFVKHAVGVGLFDATG